ncbi:MAG: aminotransferase class I/II-fold pyridoxal phosphate-dependent enzyme [Candidatus Thorarchaeota archaeon]
MRIDVFELERIQSLWEHIVEINLSESGIEPLLLSELVDVEDLHGVKLGYTQTNGSKLLRQRIADLYPSAGEDNIIVTNGGSEANMVTMWNIAREESRNEILMLLPNYMQIWGLAKMLGLKRNAFWLKNDGSRWAVDIEELKNNVSKNTAAIAICTPNNPTGAVLTAEELRAIADIAEDLDVWIISDEAYRGAELGDKLSPTMWDHYEKTLVTGTLSKSYAVPGLRIGWIATKDAAKIEDIWAYTDYTSIAPSALSDHLATIVLEQEMRESILDRTRHILRTNWKVVEDWLKQNNDIFECIPPEASAICLMRYDRDIDSVELANRLIKEKSVLIAPGDHFLMSQYLRLGYGHDTSKLTTGLDRIVEFLK